MDTSSGGNGASLVTLNWLRSIGFWPSRTSMPADGDRPGPFRRGVDGGTSASLEGLTGDELGTLQTSSSRACRFRLVEAGFGRACVLRICGGDESRKSQISFSRPSLPVPSAPSKGSRSVARPLVTGFFAFSPFVVVSLLLLSRGRSSSKSESSEPSSSESGTTPDSFQFVMILDGDVHKGMAQVSITVTGSLGVVGWTM